MSFAFKKFKFFEHAEIPGFSWPVGSSSYAFSDSIIAVGCETGIVQIFDDSFQHLGGFSAHGYKVLEVSWIQIRGALVLVTLGSEEPGYSSSTIKLWDVSKIATQVVTPQGSEGREVPSAGGSGSTSSAAPRGAAPGNGSLVSLYPLKAIKVFGSKAPEAEITTATVKEGRPASLAVSVTCVDAVMAVGMANGMVYLYHLDVPVIGMKGSGRQHASGAPPQLQHTTPVRVNARPEVGADSAVMGLALITGEDEQVGDAPQMASLFVVTESQTLSFNLATEAKAVLDHQGVRAPHCCVLRSRRRPDRNGVPQGGCQALAADNSDCLLMVARDEGLYEYTVDTRAGCTVFEGSKVLLLVMDRFVVVVRQEREGDVGARRATLHVLDLRFRLVAGTLTAAGIVAVAPTAGGLVVVTDDRRVILMKEVDLSVQLDALYKRSLHKLALDLARVKHADEVTVASIQQKWGDALYDRGEYDAAIGAYQETIGFLEPSYVLRRFLDVQRIHNLTSYLELLHDKDVASADHTTLLLNCYTKLKDVAKLDAFIERSGAKPHGAQRADDGADVSASSHDHHTPNTENIKFDAETVVKVLRSAGYAKQALWVAEAAGHADWVLDILMEECRAYDDALQLLEKQPRAMRASALRRVGQPLVTHRPEATTRALMELCCHPALTSTTPWKPGGAEDGYVASVADFAHLYTKTPTALLLLCEFILNTSASSSSAAALGSRGEQQGAAANEATLYHTLLELYLVQRLADQQGDEAKSGEERRKAASQDLEERHAKALDLMAAGWPPHLEKPKYDAHHVLALCRLHEFREGQVLLYEKMKLTKEVLQVYMRARDYSRLIAAALEYGDASRGGDPQVWADVLRYFVEQPGSSCEAQVVEVVGHIEANAVLPPLVVLQVLARNKSSRVSIVRQYIARQLAREMSEGSRDREAVHRMSAETAGLRAELRKLKSEAHVFQASRCSATGAPLELPAVHFLCGHSFIARALGDACHECPLCAPELRRVLEIRRSLAATGLQQDRFFTELKESADGFGVIADHFGRGVMNITPATAIAAMTSTSQNKT